jgi:hypothetical protein
MKSTLEHYAYCKYCKQDFSIQHGGRDDCRRHIKSKKHVDYSKLQSGNHKVSSFFETKESPIELQVTNAYGVFCSFSAIELVVSLARLPIIAEVLVRAHPYFFAISESGNIFLNKEPA